MKKLLLMILALMMVCGVCAMAEENPTEISADPESLVFDSFWANEDGEVEIDYEEGGFRICVMLEDGDTCYRWDYNAGYNAENKKLTVGYAAKLHTPIENKDGATGWTVDYEDSDLTNESTFEINGEGKLVWFDAKEDTGKDLAFAKIGRFGGKWISGEYKVEFTWTENHYAVCGDIAGDDETLLMNGFYNAENNTVEAMGTKGDSEENYESVFSFTEDGKLLWQDEKVPGAKDLQFERE